MRKISTEEFVRRFKHHIASHEGKVVWFVGAGCSVSSGVPDAAGLVRRWLSELKYLETGDAEGLDDWAEARFPAYDRNAPAKAYIQVHEALFYTDQDQQREQEKLALGGEPGFGYASFAQLMTHPEWGDRCNTVMTTNFDELAAEALYLYSQRKPQVLTHESFDRHVQIAGSRPTIVRLYGDAHLGAEYLDGNRRLLRQDVKGRLAAMLTECTLVFLGYGGRDECILDLMEGIPAGAPSGGVFWVNDAEPGEAIAEWLDERKGVWAECGDFDRLMFLMNREFDLGHPRIDRFDRILQKYDDQYRTLAAEQRGGRAAADEAEEPAPTEPPQAESVLEVEQSEPGSADSASVDDDVLDLDEVVAEGPTEPAPKHRIDALIAAAVKAMADEPGSDAPAAKSSPERSDETATSNGVVVDIGTSSVAAGEAPHEVLVTPQPLPDRPRPAPIASPHAEDVELDLEAEGDLVPPTHMLPRDDALRLDARFRAAIADAPRSGELLARYAQFLAIGRRDHDGAEHYFNRAVDADPDNADVLLPFARFLTTVRRDAERAEDCYRLALRADFDDPETACDYAEFLWRVRGDVVTANECFQVAAESDRRTARTLVRYARFQREAEGNEDAAFAMLKGAAQAAGQDPAPHVALAEFLAERRDDLPRAREAIKRALSLAPDDVATLTAAARFDARHEADEAVAVERFRRALEVDPANVDALLSFAALLASRGKMTEAEEQLLAARDIDPASARVALAHARHREAVGDDHAKVEDAYRRAVALDPRDAEVLARYGRFLWLTRRKPNAAADRLQKAAELDGRDPLALRSYGRFLAEERELPEDAERLLRRAVKVAPTDAGALDDLAQFLSARGRERREIDALFRRAVAAAPRDRLIKSRYARFLAERASEAPQAAAMLDEVLEADPANARALAGAAQAHFVQGRRDEGASLLARAFDAAMASEPRRRDLDVLLELWLYRYAFDCAAGSDAIKAAAWLVKEGARTRPGAHEAMVSRAIADGHPEPDLLRELVRVTTGDAKPEGLARFSAA